MPYLYGMAGIYFHIPFCKQACHYCDFHFSTSLKNKDALLVAMRKEIRMQAGYLEGQTVETLYFGGGTPSLLDAGEIMRLLEEVATHFRLGADLEVTLEANPDDLDRQKLTAYRQHTPINRFSIGIQSFYEEDLRWMNRAHTAAEAETVLHHLRDTGYENLTADLIYGFPSLSDEKWETNISKLIEFGIPHISAYSMTVEGRTALASFIQSGRERGMDDEQSARQFLRLVEALRASGYEQYEISNFAQPGHIARHNTNYWKGVPYLGVGPSAHSFDGRTRHWNIRNNALYVKSINAGELPFELETLSVKDRLNEYIMTALRTKWGISLHYVEEHFGNDQAERLRHEAAPFLLKGEIALETNAILLTDDGKLMADHIAAMLFSD